MESTIKITKEDTLEFILECRQRNIINNNSLYSMKWDWCLENDGEWFGTFKEGQLVAVSGIHRFRDGWRWGFRGAQINTRPVLNKYHFSSHIFYHHLPLQLQYAHNKDGDATVPFYNTTNISNTRIDKVFHYLHKQGIVKWVERDIIHRVPQNLWQLEKDSYYNVRYA